MLKVVLDTNTYISGILFKGAPRQIMELIIEGKIQSFFSEEIIQEVQTVLSRNKFRLTDDNVHFIISEIESVSHVVFPSINLQVIDKDPDDNKILECAIEADADAIISGDNHLLELNRFQDIEIVKASDFIKKYFE